MGSVKGWRRGVRQSAGNVAPPAAGNIDVLETFIARRRNARRRHVARCDTVIRRRDQPACPSVCFAARFRLPLSLLISPIRLCATTDVKGRPRYCREIQRRLTTRCALFSAISFVARPLIPRLAASRYHRQMSSLLLNRRVLSALN